MSKSKMFILYNKYDFQIELFPCCKNTFKAINLTKNKNRNKIL